VFRGVYHGKQAHPSDLADVIARAREVGVEKMMVTGSDLKESMNAIKVARDYGALEHHGREILQIFSSG
jgi:TatD DNase family protein